MAEIKEATIQNTMVKAKGLNICPLIPLIRPMGMNTTQVVAVEPMIDWTTIPLPLTAASAYSRKPTSSVERKQLSRTTIELSTIIPTPRTRALRVIMFKEKPAAHMPTRAARIEIGMEVPTIREAFRSPKNRKMMTMDTMTAMIMVWNTDFKELSS